MNNEKLENLRKDYLNTDIPQYLKLHGWDDLSQKLFDQEEKKLFTFPVISIGFAVIALMVFSSTIVFASQPSKPGDNLYQVKLLSDKIYTQITGDYESTIDKRAEEVIKLKDESGDKFDEATKEYKKTLDAAKENSINSQENEKEQLRQKLKEQEKRFQEISNEGSKNLQQLQNVLDQTRTTRGEVRGAKDNRSKREKGQNKSNDIEDNNEHKENFSYK